MDDPYSEQIMDDAERVVVKFINRHHAAAIPALIGYCVMWAVDNGGLDLIKETLANASRAADDMEKVRGRGH
jgi:hypothetical protein